MPVLPVRQTVKTAGSKRSATRQGGKVSSQGSKANSVPSVLVATMLTAGSSGVGWTLILTGSDVAIAPPSSVATAVST